MTRSGRIGLGRSLPLVAVLGMIAMYAAAAPSAAQPAPAVTASTSPDPADFPRFDAAVAALVVRGASVKALASRLTTAPDDADLPQLLAEQERLGNPVGAA